MHGTGKTAIESWHLRNWELSETGYAAVIILQ